MTTQMKENVSAWPSSSPVPGSNEAIDADRKVRVIFVEDDDDYRDAVSAELFEHGFAVQGFPDGTSMLNSISDGTDAEMILLDWSLPSVQGIDLLPRLRRQGVALPVIFLTGRSSPDCEKLALDRGALDFVDKSRGVPILAQRLRLIAELDEEAGRTRGRGNLPLRPPPAEAPGEPRLLGRCRPQSDPDGIQDRAPARVERGQLRDVSRRV